VPLIDFNLEGLHKNMLTKVEHLWAMHFLFSAPYCLQLGDTCKVNGQNNKGLGKNMLQKTKRGKGCG
jgi:hypothetical protein